MSKNKIITVFGANGNVGSHFVKQALAAGFKLRAFVRSPHKFKHADNPNIEVVQGDATNYEDVERVLAGSDVVVSCLGNVKKVLIMYTAHDNILKAAAKQAKPPRCLLISSIGCGGTSWLVKTMLILIGGKTGFDDYEKADKRVREEKTVPFLLVRPYALTDKEGKGTYMATKSQKGTFLKPISRSDVAKFMVDSLSDVQWDGSPGVLLGGAKG